MLPSSAIWGVSPTQRYSAVDAAVVAAAGAATAAKPAAPSSSSSAVPAPAAPAAAPSKDDIERLVLQQLGGRFANSLLLGLPSHDDVVGCIKSLAALDMIVLEQHDMEESVLVPAGEDILARNTSPEHAFLGELLANGNGEFPKKAPTDAFALLGYKQCIEKQWISVKTQQIVLQKLPERDAVLDALLQLSSASPEVLAQLAKRKLVKKQKKTYFSSQPGAKFALERRQVAADLTKQLLDSGEWSKVEMRAMNLHSMGQPVQGGTLHPLLKVRAEFRRILLGMGFEEMPTSKWVDSSFWNFDSLFQPQQHPARDAHDTFFISTDNLACESKMDTVPADYVQRVKDMHEVGGQGSFGYKYDWSLHEAKRNVLRTHTTAISSQLLFKMANETNKTGVFRPKKYFSVDRVFRNETVDKTHLAEFHQVEGLVADYGLTVGDLKGTIRSFFNAIGITQVRFKPAYNPYTEPSMEIFGFHPELKKWTEIGNSGMFRPEMLLPMGLPEGVRVIAWGLSLERPTMIMTGEDHIKNLFGSGVSFDMMRAFPIARFDAVEVGGAEEKVEGK